MKQFIAALLVALIAGFSSPSAHAEFGMNLGLGYGKNDLKFGDSLKFEPQSTAGHLEFFIQGYGLILGAGHMTVTQLNLDDERSYASMTSILAGVALGSSVHVIVGGGLGKWRRKRLDEIATPNDSDYWAVGNGVMAGVRIYLIKTPAFSAGLSATYFRMTADEYTSIEDGVETKVAKESIAESGMVGLVFRFSDVPGGKSSK